MKKIKTAIAILILFIMVLMVPTTIGLTWVHDVGILSADAVVFASDAPAVDKVMAKTLGRVYGNRVQVCDGTADDVEIQAAIDAMTSGGGLRIKGRTFTTAASINPTDNLDICGDGREMTTIKLAAASNCDVVTSDNTNMIGVSLRGLTIDGNRADNTAGRGLDGVGISYLTLRDVTITQCYEEGLYGYCSTGRAPYDTGWWTLNNVIVRYSGQDTATGLKSGIYAENLYGIFGNILDVSYNYGRGMQLVNCFECSFTQTTADQNNSSGIAEVGISLYTGSRYTFYGGYIGKNNYGLYLYSTERVAIHGINFEGNTRNIVIAGASDTVNIIGNSFDNGGTPKAETSVRLTDTCNNLTISGNTFEDYATAYSSASTGSGIEVRGNIGYIASGELRTYAVTITAGDNNTTTYFQNPFTQAVWVTEVRAQFNTAATAGNPVYDMAVDADGSGLPDGAALFTDIPDTAGTYWSWSNAYSGAASGVQTGYVQLGSNASTSDWLGFAITTDNGTGLVATVYVTLMGQ